MKAGTILFVTPPEGGHLIPTLPVARGLATQGFSITYLTAGFFSSVLEANGFDLVPLLSPEKENPPMQRSGWTYWYMFNVYNGVTADIALADRIQEIVQARNVVGVVVDSLYVDYYGQYLEQYLEQLPSFCLSVTLPNWGDGDSVNTTIPRSYLCPPEFEMPATLRRSSSVHYMEPSVSIGVRSETSMRVQPVTPHVLAAFGTQSVMHESYELRLHAIEQLAHRYPQIVFTIAGIKGSEARSKDNIRFVNEVHQREMLNRSSLFITHGGLGSVKEAIIHGVPMIVLPELFDQPYNAMRVEKHGLGRAIFPCDLTPTSLKIAFEEVYACRTISRIVDHFQEIFLESQRKKSTAALISRYLASSGPH
jgi:UDP:flavonoid glycosyltransferase YjiC (YdhE family)